MIGAAPTLRPDGRVDRLFVASGLALIVCSGTPVAGPVLIGLGLVGVARIAVGRPISTAWTLLAAPPMAYIGLGLANGQLADLSDLRSAITTDFRVLGLVPVLLFVSTRRRPPADARESLVALVHGVTVGLAVSLVLRLGTNVGGNLPFSSHHAVGFAAALVLIVVAALPTSLVRNQIWVVGVSSLALIASGSRSGLVAATLGLGAAPLLRLLMGGRTNWTVGKLVRFVLMALAIAGAATALVPRSVERFTSTTKTLVDRGLDIAAFADPNPSADQASLAERNVAIRLSVWEELAGHAGLSAQLRTDAGTVDDLLVNSPERESVHRVFSAHNLYLQLIVEIGWIGMLAYVGTSTAGIRLLLAGVMIESRVAIVAIWVATLGFGLTSNSLLSPAVMVPAVYILHLLGSDPSHRAATSAFSEIGPPGTAPRTDALPHLVRGRFADGVRQR